MVRFILLALLVVEMRAATAMVESRAESKLTLPAKGEILLIDFRTDSVRDWKISGATLQLFIVSGDAPKTMELSLISTSWKEPEKGLFAKERSCHCAVTVLEQGWIRVTLPTAFVEALAAGKAYGLAIAQGTVKINGRAPVFRQPFILAEGEPR